MTGDGLSLTYTRRNRSRQIRFCFVSTSRGSHFMTELLDAVAEATVALGYRVELAFDRFPALCESVVYVVVPHEFRAWGEPGGFPNARQRARTIALCTENPGTPWFEETCELAPQFAAAISINRSSANELERRGIRCEHLQLGYSERWDSWQRDESIERPIDALYLGAADPRRDPLLAGFGRDLSARMCQFLVPPLEPRTRPRPDFLRGPDKYHRLRSAKILLNLHRTTSSALEWMRFLEAICNGCVVVSEPCLDGDPLVAGEHYVAAPIEGMPYAVNSLLEDPDRLELMRTQAYDFVREALPMEPAAKRLAELGAELSCQPPAAGDSPLPKETQSSLAPPDPGAVTQPADATMPTEAQPTPEAQLFNANPSASPVTIRAPRDLLRRVSNRFLNGRRSHVQIVQQTPTYAGAQLRVTVVLAPVNDPEPETVEALASVTGSHCREREVLVLDDDASSGKSAQAARDFLDDHPSLPARLLRQPLDRGLGHTRNTLIKHARGEYVLILSARGGIYPSSIQRLVTALDDDPQALFCYPMVAVLEGDRPVQLASSLPWEPERLARGNWIDGIALIRRSRLLELGGYSTDPRLAGWEDFDLWCRCAQAGAHGVHVPQVLAWRRRTASSAGADSENDTPAKWELMRARFPQLLAPSGSG
jgi:hypothetical protein